MKEDQFYALKLSFHPKAKTEDLKTFNTVTAADNYASSVESGGDCWVILEKVGDSFMFHHGVKKQKNNE